MDYTPRIKLPKPALAGEVIDPAMMRSRADIMDQFAGWFVCTSVSRPAEPFEGLGIYETDTKARYIYSGGWRYIGGLPAFRISQVGTHGTIAEVLLALAGTEYKYSIPGLTAGDRYLVEVSYKQRSSVANDRLGLNIRHRTNAVLDAVPANNPLLRTGVQNAGPIADVGYEFQLRAELVAAGNTDTIGIYHLRAGGTGNVTTSDVDLKITRMAE